jgi:transcriptional regulator with XRE-family HTH domain
MDNEKLKILVGCNIAACRKRAGMTQAELALKLNYTDKAVSKWERGESVPDLITLIQLAELFGISLDALTADPNALPEDAGALQQTMDRVVQKTLKRKADKRIIVWLCSLIVWFFATLAFVVVTSARLPYGWLAFLFAVPADAIVVLSLRSAWRDFRSNLGLISVMMWGVLASVFAVLALALEPYWLIFLLGIPGQLAIFLWFRLFRTAKEEKDG